MNKPALSQTKPSAVHVVTISYRFDQLPEGLKLGQAIAAATKEHGAVGLYALYKSDESLIPEECKDGRVIFFPETEFLDGVYQYVRDLCWNGSCWYWNYDWVGNQVDSSFFVAVPASSPRNLVSSP
jgi:hypothetical protein